MDLGPRNSRDTWYFEWCGALPQTEQCRVVLIPLVLNSNHHHRLPFTIQLHFLATRMSNEHRVSLGGFDAWLEYHKGGTESTQRDSEPVGAVALHGSPASSKPSDGTKGMIATVKPLDIVRDSASCAS